MKIQRNMLALLVATPLGLSGVAGAAASDIVAGPGAGTTVTPPASQEVREGRGARRESNTTDRANSRQRRAVDDINGGGRTGRRVAGSRTGSSQSQQTNPRRSTDRRFNRPRDAERIDRRQVIGDGRYARDHRRGAYPVSDRHSGRAGPNNRFRDTRTAHLDRGRLEERGGFDNRVDRRLSKQRTRIRDGWQSGELSRGEFRRLRKDQKQIARMDRRFGSDGRYTKRERRQLNRVMDRASNRVYRAKHNARTAYRSGSHRRRH
jgi:hypothetical protein